MTKILSMQSLNQPERFSLNVSINNFENLESIKIYLESTAGNFSEVRGMTSLVD